MTDYQAFLRRRMLEQMYDRLDDKDKQTFMDMTMQGKSDERIMQALNGISKQVDRNRHSFSSDLLANISGNIITDGAFYLLKRLLRL